MRYCRYCGVKLVNNQRYCPLCDMETVEADGGSAEDYPYVKPRLTRRMFIKSITFSVIVAVVLIFLIDHLLPYNTGVWYLLATVGLIYGWLSFVTVMKNLRDPGAIVFSQLILASLCTAAVDKLCGWYRWSVNYVIPGLVAAAAIAIVLCISIRPDKFRTYTIYQIVIAFIGLVPVGLWAVGFSEIEWTAVAAAAVALLCFAVILVFSHRHTRSELKKRFHV